VYIYAYLSNDVPRMILSTSRMVQWTLRYGVNDYSPVGFAAFGLMVSGINGDLKAGAVYANTALTMLNTIKTKITFCRTTYISRNGILNWSTPMQSSLKPLSEGYNIGMHAGDTESAMWACYIGISVASVSGKALQSIEKDCSLYIPQMEELGRKEHAGLTRLERQTALNLMGMSDNTVILTGDAMDERLFLDQGHSPEMQNAYEAYKSVLYSFFGEHKLGAELAIAKGNAFVKGSPGMVLGIADAFARGISLYSMARETKSTKYKKEATRPHKLLKSWLKKGNPNVQHHVAILDAELAALQGKSTEASKLYRKGIVLSTRAGFIHGAALASERYAEYLLDLDKQEALFQMSNAIEYYGAWGAKAKIRMLHERHTDLWQSHQ